MFAIANHNVASLCAASNPSQHHHHHRWTVAPMCALPMYARMLRRNERRPVVPSYAQSIHRRRRRNDTTSQLSDRHVRAKYPCPS